VIFYHPQFMHVFLSFEQLIGQQMVQLQDSILKRLHHHTLSNILSNGISKAHCARILSCFGPEVGAYLIIWPIFPSFWLTSLVFSTMFQIRLGPRHPSIANIPWCVCTHPSTLWVLNSYIVLMATNTHEPMISLCGMLASMWGENNYMHFLQTRSIHPINESTLCSPKITFAS